MILGIGIGLGVVAVAIIIYTRRNNKIYELNLSEINKRTSEIYIKTNEINKQISEINKNISLNNRISKAILISLQDLDSENREKIKKLKDQSIDINNENTDDIDDKNTNNIWDIERDIDGSIKSIKIKKSGYTISKPDDPKYSKDDSKHSEKLNDAGDNPWSEDLLGSYIAGQAGYIIGTNTKVSGASLTTEDIASDILDEPIAEHIDSEPFGEKVGKKKPLSN